MEFVLAKGFLGRVRRWTRAVQVLAVLAGVASCSDSAGTGPIAAGHARLQLVPRFETVAGAPAVPLSQIVATLAGPSGSKTVDTARFVDGSASLNFDVLVTSDRTNFTLDLVALDVSDVEAFRAHQAYVIRPGDNTGLEQPVLVYSAPDAKAVALHFDPSSVTLDAGGTARIAVKGTDANNAAISPVRVAWTSRDPTIVTLDNDGNVVAGQLKGQTYVVARTPANLADSVLVTTRGAVAQITPTPASLAMFRGATATVSAEARDPSGTVISDRPPVLTSSDDKVVTVTAAGIVTAVDVGSASIKVTVGEKSTSVPVTVTSPVAGVQLAPPTVTLANIGDSQLLTATVVAKAGASVSGLTPTFTTSDAAVAGVGPDGRVTATGWGIATITATIESFSATTTVSVVSALVVAPATPTVFTSSTQQFSVTAGGKGPFTWSVNGVAGGNATVGQITASGSYRAPAQIPTPASFDICAVQTSPASQGCTHITIASPVAGITLAPPTVTLANLGDVQQLTATIVPKAGASVSGLSPAFTTSDGAVATVSADGRVTAAGYGTATITAKIESFTATTSVSVVGPLALSPETPTVFTGGTQQFSVTAGGKGPFTWSVNGATGGNTTVGQISASGLYTAPAQIPTPASFDICAIQVAPSTQGCTHVTVASPVAGIQLAPPTVTLANIGDNQQLTATILSKPGGSVAGLTPSFTTSDGTVATVSADGRVTAAGYGVATITAKIESFTATTTVSVVGPLVLAPATPSLLTNATQQFSVTAGGKGPFTWTVNGVTNGNATVGQISASGLYTAPAQVPAPASFDICATQAVPPTQGCTHVTITSSVAGITLAPPTVTLVNIGDTQQLTATILAKPGGSVAGLTPAFTTSDGTVATVSADGRVTAAGYGTATITAKIESFTATTSVSVAGPLVLAPASPTIFRNATQQFSVTAGGSGPFTWTVGGVTGGNSTVGVISGSGLYTAPAQIPSPASFDVCAIQVSPSTTGCTHVTVASPVAGIQLAPPAVTIAYIGGIQQLTATIVAKPGGSVAGLTPTFTTSNSAVATVGTDGRVTATGWGIATITARIETFSATTAVSVVAPLTISPATATRLPNGTQQFSVLSGGNGPFTWTVNGVTGGNATYGTITPNGFYTAPSAVPATPSFKICAVQASPSADGCANMTIHPISPTSADLIVFNDINIFNSPTSTSGEPVLADSADNEQLYRNIVNYTGPGIRATKTRVAMYFGHQSQLAGFPADAHFDLLKTQFGQAGFTTDSLTADLTSPLDPAYKVIILVLPTTAFSNVEVNNLKQFSADGGRIVFIGEWGPLYTGRNVENDLLSKLGTQMTDLGGSFDGGDGTNGVVLPASSLRTHQLTTGLSGLWVASSAALSTGPTDFGIIYDSFNQRVLVAAAKVDVTPLDVSYAGLRFNSQSVTTKTTSTIAAPVAGTPGRGPRP